MTHLCSAKETRVGGSAPGTATLSPQGPVEDRDTLPAGYSGDSGQRVPGRLRAALQRPRHRRAFDGLASKVPSATWAAPAGSVGHRLTGSHSSVQYLRIAEAPLKRLAERRRFRFVAIGVDSLRIPGVKTSMSALAQSDGGGGPLGPRRRDHAAARRALGARQLRHEGDSIHGRERSCGGQPGWSEPGPRRDRYQWLSRGLRRRVGGDTRSPPRR